MSLSIAIVGLPNVGKSTLFNVLTKNNVLAANYPFATIEPNVGIVPVPDERLKVLSVMYKPQQTIAATVTFTDIAGLVAGAHKGEGLGNQFLANIREAAAIAQVVRAFSDTNVTHVDTDIHPKRDIETINTELILADMQTIDKRLSTIAKTAKADPKARIDIQALEQIKNALDKGRLIYNLILEQTNGSISEFLEQLKISDETAVIIRNLLTAKPFIYVFNIDEDDLSNEAKKAELAEMVKPAKSVFISAKLEQEISELSDEDAKELLESVGQTESGLEQLIRVGYETLGLQSYFTAGEKEVRAWTIPQGATAPQAAGVIHTDFERGFIAAEIVNYKDLVESGSKAAAKAAGKVRTEGKTYTMVDGDIVEFRFNV